MVITVYVSGISGNKEVKKRQQKLVLILDSRGIEYETIDIAEPGRQTERDRIKEFATKPALPPQIFNGDKYCGGYDQFDLANENDEIEAFLGLPSATNGASENLVSSAEVTLGNGVSENHVDEVEETTKTEEAEKEVESEKVEEKEANGDDEEEEEVEEEEDE